LHERHLWLSMRQAKVDFDSLELKPKEAVLALVEPLGPEAIVVSGAVVSVGAGGVVGVLGLVEVEGWLGCVVRWRKRLGRSGIRWWIAPAEADRQLRPAPPHPAKTRLGLLRSPDIQVRLPEVALDPAGKASTSTRVARMAALRT
jgi:hypothetical protein